MGARAFLPCPHFRGEAMRGLLLGSIALLSTACGGAVLGDPSDPAGGDTAHAGACSSDSWWTRGNAGSSVMRPGGDCIGCHKQMGAPRYDVAGTVYREYDEPDDCDGAMGIVVEVTGADGRVFRVRTNGAGNFTLRDSALRFPATTRVIEGDRVLEMSGEIDHGDCAACHTAEGREGAPGRVVTP